MYAMHVRSPSGTSSPGTGSVDLPTGRLSPVSAASSISRVAARTTRPSAGTRLPASTSTTSPGTSSSASISTAWPSRRTRAIVFIICASALTLSSALASWRRPTTALNTVSPASTTVVPVSPVTSWLTRAAPRSTTCMKSSYWRRKARQPGSCLPAASRFAPCVASREAASSAVRPWAGSTSRLRATSAASLAVGFTPAAALSATSSASTVAGSPCPSDQRSLMRRLGGTDFDHLTRSGGLTPLGRVRLSLRAWVSRSIDHEGVVMCPAPGPDARVVQCGHTQPSGSSGSAQGPRERRRPVRQPGADADELAGRHRRPGAVLPLRARRPGGAGDHVRPGPGPRGGPADARAGFVRMGRRITHEGGTVPSGWDAPRPPPCGATRYR